MTEVEFHATFKNFVIAHKRIGYKTTWNDKEQYRYKNEVHYVLNVPSKSGDLYFMVQSYFEGMVPKINCVVEGMNYNNNGILPQVTIKVFNGVWPDVENSNTLMKELKYYDKYNQPIHIKESEITANMDLVISVKYDWMSFSNFEPPSTPDYTLSLYSAHRNMVLK